MNKASKLIKKSIVFTKKSAIFAPASLLQDSIAQLVEHNTFNVGVLGSSPSRVTFFLLQLIITDSIAQLVEHNIFNVGVLGSSPSRVTSWDKSVVFRFVLFLSYLWNTLHIRLGFEIVILYNTNFDNPYFNQKKFKSLSQNKFGASIYKSEKAVPVIETTFPIMKNYITTIFTLLLQK